jgi:hypothetical protein
VAYQNHRGYSSLIVGFLQFVHMDHGEIRDLEGEAKDEDSEES